MPLARLISPAVLVVTLLGTHGLRADDLTTLSGTTYRGAVPIHVEPDGITWRHAEGVAKVDFADTPEAIRRAYHYDAATAAAYHAAHAQEQAAADAQKRQLLDAEEERRKAHFQEVMSAGFASANGGTFSLQRGSVSPQTNFAERLLGEQIDALKEKQATLSVERERVGVANQLLGKVLPVFHGGTGAADRAVQDYRASSQHPLHEGADHAWDDGAYQPNYMARDYYEGVDRSAALLRNAGW